MPYFLFQLLVLFLPTQLGFHFWPLWSHIYGIRVDYLSPTLYLTDLLVIALFFSSLPPFFCRQIYSTKFVIFFLLLFILIFLNITTSLFPFLTLYKWLKIFEIAFLGFFVSVNKTQIINKLNTPLSLAILFSFLIALAQFILQKSAGGPLYWLGERSFTSVTPGIALFSFLGNRLLRPYATFPHPNALSGFALVSAILLMTPPKKSSLNYLAITTCIFLIIISFSRTTWISSIIILMLYLFKKHLLKPVSLYLFLLSTIIFSLSLPLFAINILKTNSSQAQTIKNRLELSVAAGQIFTSSPMLGIGLGNFITALPKSFQSIKPLLGYSPSWYLQPVHNIFLLTATETGIIGLILFITFLSLALKNSLSHQHYLFSLALLAILLTGLNDHYWLTLQQTGLLFSIALGLSFSSLLK